MRTVNGNWSAVVKELRRIVVKHTQFEMQEHAHAFSDVMFTTDTFHPFDCEGERLMERVLRGMPVRCDYRNCESLATWKDFKEQLIDAVYIWCVETEYLITDHYNDSWNFAPGYVRPASIKHDDWLWVANKVFARVHRAALKGMK